jgi:hypothetical protein
MIQLSSCKLIISTVVWWRFTSVQVCRWVKQSSVLSILSYVSDTFSFQGIPWRYVLKDVRDVSRVFHRVRLQNARNFQKTDLSRSCLSPFLPEEGQGFSLRNIVSFKPDTMDSQACIFIMKLINNMEPATDLFMRPIWTVEVPCLYGIGRLAFLGFWKLIRNLRL